MNNLKELDYQKALKYWASQHEERCREIQALIDENRDLRRKLNLESQKYEQEQIDDAKSLLDDQWWQHQDNHLSAADIEELER